MGVESGIWLSCSTCKGDLGFDEVYYLCSVSTCQRGSTNLRFCSIDCWEAHVPTMRHRDAWAAEARTPSAEAWARENPEPTQETAPRELDRRVVSELPASPGELRLADHDIPRATLVVVSKLKAYVRARTGMNTSEGVATALSNHLRQVCDAAARNASLAGRKTVMDRDFQF